MKDLDYTSRYPNAKNAMLAGPEKQLTITDHFEQLERAQIQLSETLHGLYNKLEPVMSTDYPRPGAADNNAVLPDLSPMAVRIMSSTRRLEDMINEVSYQISRIQLP